MYYLQNRPSKHIKDSAFTLLELMLAVAIISISLVLTVNSFSLIAQSKAAVSNYTKALFLLQEKLYDLKTTGFDKSNQEGTFKAPFEKFSWYADSRTIPINGIRKVSLAVSWKQGNRNQEFRIFTDLGQEVQ